MKRWWVNKRYTIFRRKKRPKPWSNFNQIQNILTIKSNISYLRVCLVEKRIWDERDEKEWEKNKLTEDNISIFLNGNKEKVCSDNQEN